MSPPAGFAPLAADAKKLQAGRMGEWLQHVAAEIRKRDFPPPGEKILVAVSGGADSMVLLHVLHRLAPERRWKIIVAHFNHRLRGRASLADERLVRRTAEKYGLPFAGAGADVKEFAARSKISVEMAARKLRHEFLARLARRRKISVISLAHHADDQVELFFLRLLRGTGGTGLAGMKSLAPSPADGKLTLFRPLLDCGKAEILACARAEKIPFRDDATNFSPDFLRNRIRNELLPLLQKNYQPGLSKTVLRLMAIASAEAEFADATAQAWLSAPADQAPARVDFSRLPVAVQRKALQQQLAARGVVSDFELIEQLRIACDKPVSIDTGVSVTRDAAGEIRIAASASAPFAQGQQTILLRGGTGRIEFGGRQFSWRQKKLAAATAWRFGRHPVTQEFFDAEKVGSEIILRHWRAGDRFQPIGLPAATKLQDLFVNAKIPAQRRRELVLATTAAGEIFWVEGLRIGERFKLTPATRRELEWRWDNKKSPQ